MTEMKVDLAKAGHEKRVNDALLPAEAVDLGRPKRVKVAPSIFAEASVDSERECGMKVESKHVKECHASSSSSSSGSAGRPQPGSVRRLAKSGRKLAAASGKYTPKRALTAYTCYVAEHRSAVMLANTHLNFQEVATIVGKMWRDLPPIGRLPYQAIANADKERYEREKVEGEKAEQRQAVQAHARANGVGGFIFDDAYESDPSFVQRKSKKKVQRAKGLLGKFEGSSTTLHGISFNSSTGSGSCTTNAENEARRANAAHRQKFGLARVGNFSSTSYYGTSSNSIALAFNSTGSFCRNDNSSVDSMSSTSSTNSSSTRQSEGRYIHTDVSSSGRNSPIDYIDADLAVPSNLRMGYDAEAEFASLLRGDSEMCSGGRYQTEGNMTEQHTMSTQMTERRTIGTQTTDLGALEYILQLSARLEQECKQQSQPEPEQPTFIKQSQPESEQPTFIKQQSQPEPEQPTFIKQNPMAGNPYQQQRTTFRMLGSDFNTEHGQAGPMHPMSTFLGTSVSELDQLLNY